MPPDPRPHLVATPPAPPSGAEPETPAAPAALPGEAQRLAAKEARLAAVAAREADPGALEVHYLFVQGAQREELLVPVRDGEALPSITPWFPAAEWFERELHESWGVRVEGHPGLKPLLAHTGWPGGAPMRSASRQEPAPREPVFPFRRVEGDGVYEVPVGPIHAGIIEPGHFRFSLAGERVLHLEVRLGYAHRGVEKLMQGKRPQQALILAERVSGDNSAAHAAAFCQALEALARERVPPRAAHLRTLLLETERITNHLADVGGVVLDVAYGVGWARCARLREDMLRAQARLAGSRLLFGALRPGGTAIDPPPGELEVLSATATRVSQEFSEVLDACLAKSSVLDRLEGTGRLPRQDALALGVVGPAARASGVDMDARRDWPHAAYPGLAFHVPVLREGDVLARVRVKQAEVVQSAGLVRQCVESMPQGPVLAPLGALEPGRMAWAATEAHRGELVVGLAVDEGGRVARCAIRDPSFVNWRALERAVPLENILADFPVVNKSFNLSYAGNDR